MDAGNFKLALHPGWIKKQVTQRLDLVCLVQMPRDVLNAISVIRTAGPAIRTNFLVADDKVHMPRGERSRDMAQIVHVKVVDAIASLLIALHQRTIDQLLGNQFHSSLNRHTCRPNPQQRRLRYIDIFPKRSAVEQAGTRIVGQRVDAEFQHDS